MRFEARVEVREIASRRRRGHVRGRAGERAEEVRAPARVPAGRVPPVEPRAPRRVRGRRDGASRVRRRLGGFECHRSETRVEGRPRGRRLRRGRGGRFASRLRAGIGHPHPARALRGARLSLWRATSAARFEPSEWRAFHKTLCKIKNRPRTRQTETAFDRLRPLFFFRASFRFQRKKNAQRKNTFRMHTSPTLLHHRSMAVGASHFFTLFEPAFASGLYLSLPNALARGTPCGTRAGDRRQGERVRRRVHRDTRGESSSGTSVFGAREGGEGSGTGSAMVATRRRATRDASNAKKPLKDVSNGDAATATKLPRKIPGTGPSTAPPAAAVVARNTRSSRKKPVANVGRTRAGPVAHDADASEEATEPVRLEAKFERAAKEEPAKKKRKALETIEIDVNDRAPGPRRVTRARTRKSTTPRLSAFPLCTRRSARGRVRFLPRAVPEPDPPLPPGRPADDGDARHTPAVDLTCDERLVAERGTSTTVPPVLSRRPSRPCFRVFPCTREEFEPTEILNLRARARSRHDR